MAASPAMCSWADLYQLLSGLAVACRHGFELDNALEIAERTYVNVNIHQKENEGKLKARCRASLTHVKSMMLSSEVSVSYWPISGTHREEDANNEVPWAPESLSNPLIAYTLLQCTQGLQ